MVKSVFMTSASDSYPTSGLSRKAGVFPATLRIMDLVGLGAGGAAGGKSALRVAWQSGSMPRTPLSWAEWSAGVYEADVAAARDKAPPAYDDYKAAARERESAAAAAKAAEEAAREAEKQAIRDEAVAALASQRLAQRRERGELQAALAEARTGLAFIERKAINERMARAAAEAELATLVALAAEASEAGGGGGGSSPPASACLICLEAAACVVLLPCGHVCVCEADAAMLIKRSERRPLCPVCRGPIAETRKVYL